MKKLYIDPTSEDYKEKAAELSAKYEQVLKEYLLPMIPAEMRSFVQSPYTLFKDGVTTMQKFSAPWFESMGKMFDLMMQAGLKDPSKSSDLMLLWKSNYDKTVGELMKSPVVGSNRELIEQQNKAVDRLVEMTLAMSEYIGSIMTVANEKSKQGFEHYYEMIQKGEQPKTFNEFYKFISNEIENAIENFYYTDEFGQIIGKAADAYMQFKIELDKLIEKYLNDTPIITVSKVDNAFKNVYDLRKDMKSLTKKVADLEKKLATDKPAAK
jgi:class III poly(R)-hydroxyalkanoic acid synthase PhaE subunit